ncbi:MAG: protein kinase domain-containing protein, partial [Pseudoalteromonas sp.]
RGPPSLDTCTRDTFTEHTYFSASAVKQITKQMSSTLTHLHANNVSHGDVYAHNTMINSEHNVLFGDFGAATNLTGLTDYQRLQMQRIEVRAIGCLMDDLLSVCTEASRDAELLKLLVKQCMSEDVSQRPTLNELKHDLQCL